MKNRLIPKKRDLKNNHKMRISFRSQYFKNQRKLPIKRSKLKNLVFMRKSLTHVKN